MIKKIKHHIFWDKEYSIEWKKIKSIQNQKILGETDDPSCDENDRKITINSNQTENEFLETIIHESLHALFWDKLSEKEVDGAGKTIKEFLWKCGFRLKEKKKN